MSGRAKLGIVGPFSGPRAAYGALLREITMSEMAASELVGAEVLWEDDAADGARGREAAGRLVRAGVTAVVGHFNSNSACAAAAVYHEHRVPVFLPVSTANVIPHSGAGWVHRLCGTNRGQGHAMWRRATSAGHASVAALCDGSGYALEIARGARVLARDLLADAEERADAEDIRERAHQRVLCLLGTHRWCMSQLERLAQCRAQPSSILACDDCDIEEFRASARGGALPVEILRPRLPFDALIRLALRWATTGQQPREVGGPPPGWSVTRLPSCEELQ